MSRERLHPLAEDYLNRLRQTGRELPPERLRDLLAEVGGHLAEVAPIHASENDVLEALERLGPPGEIVEAEQPAYGSGRSIGEAQARAQAAPDRRGLREWAAIILLPLGGFAFGIGWLIGLILLWSSRLWTTGDKLIGTLVVPGGLATSLYALLITASVQGQSCSGYAAPVNVATGAAVGHGSFHCSPAGGASTAATVLRVALALFLILGPVVSAIYLSRRARRHSPAPVTA